MTTVTHCKRGPYDVYIGRGKCPKTGQTNIWGNPFVIGKDGSREEVCIKYKHFIVNSPYHLAHLYELKDKILGCWCKPNKSCHGDVLVELIKELLGD